MIQIKYERLKQARPISRQIQHSIVQIVRRQSRDHQRTADTVANINNVGYKLHSIPIAIVDKSVMST